MESFKFKIENKTSLYYSRFLYKAVLVQENLYFALKCKNMKEYEAMYTKLVTTSRGKSPWRKTPQAIDDKGKLVIEKLIKFFHQQRKLDNVMLRKENNKLSIFTNDLDLLDQVAQFSPRVSFYKCEFSPPGVKYFIKEPPAKFRVYMKNASISPETKQDLIQYINRTPDIKMNQTFERFIGKTYLHHVWLYNGHYIDCDEESTTFMLLLTFPEIVGKVYKLEKKQA